MRRAVGLDALPENVLPDEIALGRQKPGRTATVLYWAIIALLATSLGFAWLTKMDRIVVAKGELATTVSPTSIRPLQTTVAKQILVYPGERVKAGQLLVRFDKSLDQSAFDALLSKAESLDVEMKRLRGEIAAGPTGFARAYEPGSQGILQADRSAARRAKLLQYGSQIANSRSTLRAAIIARTVDDETTRAEVSKFRVLSDLYARGYYPKLQLVQAYESLLQSKAVLARDNAGINAAQIQSTEISAQAQEFASQQHAETTAQYVQDLREQRDTLAEMRKEQHLLALSDVRAPFDASIVDVAPQNGTAVASTQPLVTIVPLNAPLQAEVFVENKDVAYLRPGLSTRVKLDAYPFERHGWIDGHIKIIAHDSSAANSASPKGQNDEAVSNPPDSSRYRIVVALDKVRLRDVDSPRLLPGMVVESDLIVGRQNVISYIIEPLVRHFGNAFSEPTQ